MKLLSVNELSILTDCTRATVSKKLQGVKYEDGPHAAKLYNSASALRLVLGVAEATEDGEVITQAEAQRLLTIARKKEIEQNMEVTSRERIPLEDVEEINNGTFENICGILKSNVGKELTDDLLADMLAQLREVGAELLEVAHA
jgi:hypothetical protein